MVLSSILNPIMNPLLEVNSILAMVILSFLISLMISLIYKFTTNQNLMKELKSEMKELNKQMKTLRSHPEKAMKVQKRLMEINMKYMSHSMKSTLFTILPIILLFGWMSSHYAFEPLNPGEQFTVTLNFEKDASGEVTLNAPLNIDVAGTLTKTIDEKGNVKWVLSGTEGKYDLGFAHKGKDYYKEIIISTDKGEYAPVEKQVKEGPLNTISVGNEKKIVLNLFGWELGWLGTYIIFSIFFSMGIRKALKIY